MFRKPRDSLKQPEVGRPPSPGATSSKTPFTLTVPPSVPPPSKPLIMAATKNKSTRPPPAPSRQASSGSVKKAAAAAKTKQKPNGNIMSFFKKEETGLFIAENGGPVVSSSPYFEKDTIAENDEDRYNELETPSKRRRLSEETDVPQDQEEDRSLFGDEEPSESAEPATTLTVTKSGPFMEDSDSEDDEEEQPQAIIGFDRGPSDAPVVALAGPEALDAVQDQSISGNESDVPAVNVEPVSKDEPPSLIKEETSYGGGLEEYEDFEGVEGDFDEDINEEGDETFERRYMEEQARLEAEEDEKDYDSLPPSETIVKAESVSTPNGTTTTNPTCPICSVDLVGISEQDAGIHVNNCLDGNPTPLPKPKQPLITSVDVKPERCASPAQYKRPVRPAKPGQQNPFMLGEQKPSGGSAFSKLMSGHAEDAAWAAAAASENASRGKPAYTRTCPFYKILPGLSICVDAFRYGAVEGCQAYFLSHFHSDHYIGLTSTWTHGPIYCSRVTANLVRQQLRVDAKYVIGLEFEETIDVPNTRGVKVTMISANHCPGSSLFLFEKVIGKKTNGEPRLHRILHCGDFRACRAHVEHPLLMPNVQNKVNGKTEEQKIDVCYLDTTYLNPKYAFPPQEAVIKACADMCVSLSKVTPDGNDGWEQMKRQRAGEGMTKFIQRENSVKEEKAEDGTEDLMKVERNPKASQQIISSTNEAKNRGRLLVVIGTYSIGKERVCLGVARALNSKIFAPTAKRRIVAALEDPELDALMTDDPRAAQVHMTPLFEINADTLDDYLKDYFPHFTRAVGFRPSGWNYRPPNSRFVESPSVQTVLNSDNWKSNYTMRELVPQRGSTSRASCFGVPYSEHSSFRELTVFCCALRIEKVIPTVNVGNAKGRERMKAWCERWAQERKKNGLWPLPEGTELQ
jgi:DNA cross-link repair 1A protein